MISKTSDLFAQDSSSGTSRASWMGLVMNHRQVFDALDSGWLSPLLPSAGVLLSVEAYVSEQEAPATAHSIRVGVKLDVQKLPDLDVQILCGKEWKSSRLSKIDLVEKQLVYWPGVLPTFAISDLTVETKEESIRLKGLAKMSSTIDLSSDSISIGVVHEEKIESDIPSDNKDAGLNVPGDANAIHGALSMAVWAIPLVDPWMDVLTASLISRHTEQLNYVKAGWWKYPPWRGCALKDHQSSDLQECFWLAAVEVFRQQSAEKYVRSQELAEKISDEVSRFEQTKKWTEAISKWLSDTKSILRSETVLGLNERRDRPVELAVQLVLTRSEPVKLKTWFKDMPDLPPAIWWSAAVLCGLLQGYRRLDMQFRGESIQRELLSIHALRMCSQEASHMKWPSCDVENVRWRREADQFMLSWGDRKFELGRAKERAAWYVADFNDDRIRNQAQRLSQKLGWPCSSQSLLLKDIELPFSGDDITVSDKTGQKKLVVTGEVRILLPENHSIDQSLDVEGFRRLVSVEGGLLDPPLIQEGDTTQDKAAGPDGLEYIPDFITEEEEEYLLRKIDQEGEWDEDMTRRVQHYGWRYNYKARTIDASMQLGELPPWADKLAKKLRSEDLVKHTPDQVIVNEYMGEQSIAWHTDSEDFEDGIATISLLESWSMLFRKGKEDSEQFSQRLEQRSVAVMSGDARYKWKHTIPKRMYEPPGRKNKRGRRISLTFRKVKVSETN